MSLSIAVEKASASVNATKEPNTKAPKSDEFSSQTFN